MEENNKGLFSSVLTTPVRRWGAGIVIWFVATIVMIASMELLSDLPNAIAIPLGLIWVACISATPVTIVRNIAAPGSKKAVLWTKLIVLFVSAMFIQSTLRKYFGRVDYAMFMFFMLPIVVGVHASRKNITTVVDNFIKPAWNFVIRIFKA